MTRPALEVADVFRAHGPDYLEAFGAVLSPAQRRTLKDRALGRTAAPGGHVEACDRCGHERVAYNSCRNRHGPKCQAATRAPGLAGREAERLPVAYFHVVVTLPHQLGPRALQNQRALYGLPFHAAADTLRQIAADPEHLGAAIGLVAVLHPWGQNLLHPPHVHCVVPGGGLSPDGRRWVSCRPGFLWPVPVLGRVFRGKFLARLDQAFARGKLTLLGQLASLRSPGAFAALRAETPQKAWVVYAKPPFGGPERVLQDLARYTHRVAISNHRPVELKEGKVRFRWQDYADGHAEQVMTVEAFAFIRRFPLHVAPSGFVRVRHSGLLANRQRQQQREVCRQLLGLPPASPAAAATCSAGSPMQVDSAAAATVCPACQQGQMIVVRLRPEDVQACDRYRHVPICNTS